MSKVILNEYLSDLDKIINKNSKNLTIREIINCIFYACLNTSFEDDSWKNYYEIFKNELEEQNRKGWPKLSINRNDHDKRMDVISNKPYIKSNNVLLLLLRILYIENYKGSYIYKSYRYHKILSYKISLDKKIINYSLSELFDLLKIIIMHYLKIYYDDNSIENIIGKKILSLL